MKESFDLSSASKLEKPESDERGALETMRAHLRTVREQIERVEWNSARYIKEQNNENWRSMIEDLSLLAKLETLPALIIPKLEHIKNVEGRKTGWPEGTHKWAK